MPLARTAKLVVPHQPAVTGMMSFFVAVQLLTNPPPLMFPSAVETQQALSAGNSGTPTSASDAYDDAERGAINAASAAEASGA